MKAFWWFKDSIAGMARPGFNSTHWFVLPFDEAVLMGWIGQFSSGSKRLSALRSHARDYGTKISKFYKTDKDSLNRIFDIFDNDSGVLGVLEKLNRRIQLFSSFDLDSGQIQFELCKDRLNWEIEFLKKQNIGTVVSLTEQHHNKEILQNHFEAHHIGIEDLNAPTIDQVLHLSKIIQGLENKNSKLAVHCLAGIGRTSTMLMAAHIVLGENIEDLKTLISRKNPTFVLTGSQEKFINSISSNFNSAFS